MNEKDGLPEGWEWSSLGEVSLPGGARNPKKEGEGNFLQGYRRRYLTLRTLSHGGPLTRVDGEVDGDDLRLASRIVARYSQGKNAARVEVEARWLDGRGERLEVQPLKKAEVPVEWLV